MVLRLRWSDPEADDLSTPLDWRIPSSIMATLFLNFLFWYVVADNCRGCFDKFWPRPLLVGFPVAVALLATVLFFMGPALATQATGRPLFGVVENSLGSIPAYALRFCCIVFLALWMGYLTMLPALFFAPSIL